MRPSFHTHFSYSAYPMPCATPPSICPLASTGCMTCPTSCNASKRVTVRAIGIQYQLRPRQRKRPRRKPDTRRHDTAHHPRQQAALADNGAEQRNDSVSLANKTMPPSKLLRRVIRRQAIISSQGLQQLRTRALHELSHDHRRAAGNGRTGVRNDLRIGLRDHHLLVRNPQRLRGHLAQNRVGTLAKLRRGDKNLRSPIRQKLNLHHRIKPAFA